MRVQLLVACASTWSCASSSSQEFDYDLQRKCLKEAFPQTRSDFPGLLNCLGLLGEAVEVGVQAGVHASGLLLAWRGKHLRLVDKWSSGGGSQAFYVDIANIQGEEIRLQHRVHCEARLSNFLRTGRAEIVHMDSAAAASQVLDRSLDFVYLDARHDFAGVAADIHAWWPKVKVGGVFAGHDFVDGEFPEGDFFWISALREVLPDLWKHAYVTNETNRYPSFFVIKTLALSTAVPRGIAAESQARRLYAEKSRYFSLWRNISTKGSSNVHYEFLPACRSTCSLDCDERIRHFTPTRSAASTLRPFACKEAQTEDVCAAEMVVDVKAYHDVCLDRCNVTCLQRRDLFTNFGAEILSI